MVIVVVASRLGLLRDEAIDVDADVVAVDVAELGAEDGVQLDGQDGGAGRAVGGVKEAQVLTGVGGGEVGGRGDDKGEPMVAETILARHDGEDEGRGEGARRRGVGRAAEEAERGGVEGVGFCLLREVGEREQAAGRYGGEAVQGKVGAGEALVGELAIVQRRGHLADAVTAQQQEYEQEKGRHSSLDKTRYG